MTNTLSARRLAAVAALALAIPAHAAVFLTANYTGSFDAATTFDGTALGSETAFSISANFDPSVKSYSDPEEALYPITSFTMTLAGHGTFVGIPDSDANLWLEDASLGDSYIGGIAYSGFTKYIYSAFDVSTPALNANAPSPAVFSSLNSNQRHNFNLSFDGVSGGLTVNDFGTTTPTFSLATAVPEPMETAGVIGLGLVAFAAWRRRKV